MPGSPTAPAVLVIMGVSGSGKTTVGGALATRLGWLFKEGDQLHPAANIARMTAGTPLTDADRAPWLAAIARWIDERAAAETPAVISCSALKRAYRAALSAGRPQVRIVYLDVSPALVADRLSRRRGHFMPPALMDSQFADLERPAPDEAALIVDASQPADVQVERIVERLEGWVG